MKVIIDRFEGDFAVLEMPDKKIISAPKALFKDFSEGDVLEITKDKDETEKKKQEAKDAFSALFKK